MRDLKRNQRTIWFASRVDEKPVIDEYGFETGEIEPVYTPPKQMRVNISSAYGEEISKAFGNFTDYNRVICVSDSSCPMDEQSVVWFESVPGDQSFYNNIVVRKADSKNGILYALRSVDVQ